MKIINCEQGSEEWQAVRLGRVTGSLFSQVLNKKTGRKTYMYKLAAERMTGILEEGYRNKFMDMGTENEPVARTFYELANATPVETVGFIELDEDIGVSPDGLVGDDGLIEIKCPLASTHIKNIMLGRVPAEYIPQIQGGLWVTGRKWCDFVSFNPNIKGPKYHCIRVERDEEYIENLKKECNRFVTELKAMVKTITESVPY